MLKQTLGIQFRRTLNKSLIAWCQTKNTEFFRCFDNVSLEWRKITTAFNVTAGGAINSVVTAVRTYAMCLLSVGVSAVHTCVVVLFIVTSEDSFNLRIWRTSKCHPNWMKCSRGFQIPEKFHCATQLLEVFWSKGHILLLKMVVKSDWMSSFTKCDEPAIYWYTLSF